MDDRPSSPDSGAPQPSGQTRIALQGELDLSAAAPMTDAVAQALAAGAREVLLDLADVSFLDSSGLGALVGAAEDARRHRAVLRCECPHGREARVVIALAGLESTLGLSAG